MKKLLAMAPLFLFAVITCNPQPQPEPWENVLTSFFNTLNTAIVNGAQR